MGPEASLGLVQTRKRPEFFFKKNLPGSWSFPSEVFPDCSFSYLDSEEHPGDDPSHGSRCLTSVYPFPATEQSKGGVLGAPNRSISDHSGNLSDFSLFAFYFNC